MPLELLDSGARIRGGCCRDRRPGGFRGFLPACAGLGLVL